jgi:hypothetical protein
MTSVIFSQLHQEDAVNDEWGKKWKKTIPASFNALAQHLP